MTLNPKASAMADMNEKAIEAAALVRELRNDGNSWAQPLFNRAADMIETLSVLPPLRAREEIARALYECDFADGTWEELKQAAKTHGVPWPTFTAAPYYRRADAVERCIGEPAVLKPLIVSDEGEPDREAGLSAGSPILSRTAGQEWRDISAIREWFDKHDAYHKASDFYNARLAFVEERRELDDWEPNVHTEYRILNDTQKAAIAAAETLYQTLKDLPEPIVADKSQP